MGRDIACSCGNILAAPPDAAAAWIQYSWRLHRAALPPTHTLDVRRNGQGLVLTPTAATFAESLILTFEAAGVA